MDAQKQVVDRLKQANNVLVTVSSNPSVDQLAACIGLSLALNKLDKHATAVFSGAIPSTIEFLQPEDTLEKNTDSLRDFIISLDRSKADKLRYKVEDQVVRIFITPYRTSISEADLEFSQGDFNVDVVVALGVHEQKELDRAVTAHGRILHDATVITVNNQDAGGELGSINWLNTNASSLSEMAAALALKLSDKNILDEQIATAFLTGIVAETERFSNDKTKAETMNISASLMAAGANQQLVATKLEEPATESTQETADSSAPEEPEASSGIRIREDGTLEIDHSQDEKLPPKKEKKDSEPESGAQPPETSKSPEEPKVPKDTQSEKSGDDAGPHETITKDRREMLRPTEGYQNSRHIVSPPPFSSDTDPDRKNKEETYVDPLTLPPVDAAASSNTEAPSLSTAIDQSHATLEDLERRVNSPHLQAAKQEEEETKPQDKPEASDGPEELNLADLQRPSGLDDEPDEKQKTPSVEDARDAVAAAMSENVSSQPLSPIAALNAQPLGGPLHGAESTSSAPEQPGGSAEPLQPAVASQGPAPEQTITMPLPGTLPATPTATPDQTPPQNQNQPNTAPPVPPPIIPPFSNK